MKAHLKFLAAALLVAAPALSAQTILVGDRDCFGGLGGPGPNGCTNFDLPDVPTDARSAAEIAAVNGAQQTDFYSSNAAPLTETFSVLFGGLSGVTSGTVNYRTYGLQVDQFGPLGVTFNGISVLNFLGFQDGATVVADRSFGLTAEIIESINLNGELDISISRNNSIDAVAFDFFELNYTTANVVPEPGTYALVGFGLMALGGAVRRRRSVL